MTWSLAIDAAQDHAMTSQANAEIVTDAGNLGMGGCAETLSCSFYDKSDLVRMLGPGVWAWATY